RAPGRHHGSSHRGLGVVALGDLLPVPGNRPDDGDSDADAAEPTTALPKMRAEGSGGSESDAAGDQANARGQGENGDPARQRRRAGGGLSAQDLLRREGRL
ncbi:hypothetical protein, partial [Mycobacterium avium]|uniref:hypothetical protein n=1 Tax=Mycobacterium avium TaxID=1764 RepID=UPI0021553CE2